MIKKILWVLLMMGLALFIITLQINRLGEMTPEIQMTLFMSLGIVVVLFIPPLIVFCNTNVHNNATKSTELCQLGFSVSTTHA